MSTTTLPHKGLIQVTVGSEEDTWGPFVNTNADILDSALGGIATVALAGANVVLSSGQYQNAFISFTGALAANISVTFPPLPSFYTIQNMTTNSSQFQVTLTTSLSSGLHVGMPWGEVIDIMTDGVNVKFKNLDKVGTYLQIASSTVPAWITACSVPPYLLCDGSSFNTFTYPILASLLGTNLPDCRGRTKYGLDDGAGRVSSNSGFLVGSGAERVQYTQANQMPYILGAEITQQSALNPVFSALWAANLTITPSLTNNMPPAIVAGITVIRAA